MHKLVITSRFRNGSYEVEASAPDGPENIFIYNVKDDGKLGDYVGIAFMTELAKIPVWDSSRTSNYGMRRARYHTGLARLSSQQEQTQMVTHMKQTFSRLCSQLASEEEVTEEYVVQV